MTRFLLVPLLLLLSLSTPAQTAEFVPKAEKVVDNVYAIIGPLGQRNRDNDGSNANFGFIVTAQGVILIDSGASKLGAEKLETAIRAVTGQPVRWVVNTGSQDHRWLGNEHFAGKGAQIIALKRTAATQAEFAAQHMQVLAGFLGPRLEGTQPLPATTPLDGDEAALELGGEALVLRYTDAHFPGDAWVWLPKRNVLFTGDLVYVDRILGVLPWSSVKKGQKAFHTLEAVTPKYIVPGHGGVCDLAKAKRDSGDYEDFLANVIGRAAQDMEPLDATLAKYADLPQFRHLQNYGDLHRANMNRAFVE
ncbi:MAG TPA: MBL fold metallo-hydrolase, partial [Thiobacillaceae bacterium]|nr:MBL fold metallo-hydrolase [Thiobacillaceae bacterium]